MSFQRTKRVRREIPSNSDLVQSSPNEQYSRHIEHRAEEEEEEECWAHFNKPGKSVGAPTWCTKLLFRRWSALNSHQRLNITGGFSLDGEHDVKFVERIEGTFTTCSDDFPPPATFVGRRQVLEKFLNGFPDRARRTERMHVQHKQRRERYSDRSIQRKPPSREDPERPARSSITDGSAEVGSSSSDSDHDDRGCIFISTTMSWTEAKEYGEWMQGRLPEGHGEKRKIKEKDSRTYVTVILADKVADLNPWKLLKATTEIAKYGVQLRQGGAPRSKGGTEHEVLVIERVPAASILKTYRLDDVRDWDAEKLTKTLQQEIQGRLTGSMCFP